MQFIGVGRIQHVFRELGGGFRKRHFDSFEFLFAFGIEIGTRAPKTGDGFFEKAFVDACQRLCIRLEIHRLHCRPQLLIQGDGGVEGADGPLHVVMRSTEVRRGPDGFQVAYQGHGVIERLSSAIESENHALVGARRRLAANLLNPLTHLFQQMVNGRLDMLGLDGIEGNRQHRFQQRIYYCFRFT